MDELLRQTLMTRVKTRWPYRWDEPDTRSADQFNEMKEWCRKNCRGSWRALGFYWNFDDEQDYLRFILRWS